MMMLENKKKNLQLKFLVCLSFVGVCVCVLCVWIGFKKFYFFFLVKTRKEKEKLLSSCYILHTPTSNGYYTVKY